MSRLLATFLVLGILVGCAEESADPAAAFGDCSIGGDPHFVSAYDRLAHVDRWVQLESTPSVPTPEPDKGDSNLVAADMIARVIEPDGTDRDASDVALVLHDDFIPGIEWALRNGGRAYLGVIISETGAPTADFALIETSDGSHFFTGNCQDAALTAPLKEMLGENFDRTVAKMVGLRSPATLLPAPPTDSEERDKIQILNPEDASEKLLANLHVVTLALDIPVGWRGPYTICSKIEQGWNDCVDMSGDLSRPLTINAYVGDDFALEFWLLDEGADLSSPFQRLSKLDLRAADSIDLTAKGGVILRIDFRGDMTVSNSGASPLVQEPSTRIVDADTWVNVMSDPDRLKQLTGVGIAQPDRSDDIAEGRLRIVLPPISWSVCGGGAPAPRWEGLVGRAPPASELSSAGSEWFPRSPAGALRPIRVPARFRKKTQAAPFLRPTVRFAARIRFGRRGACVAWSTCFWVSARGLRPAQ